MVLNFFRAVAHFEEPQIFVAQFLALANLFRVPWPTFVYVCDVMMTKLLGLSSELMAAEVISKKNEKEKGDCLPSAENGQFADGIGLDLQRKIRSLRLQFMGAGPYGGSYAPLLVNLIRLANPLLNTQTSVVQLTYVLCR